MKPSSLAHSEWTPAILDGFKYEDFTGSLSRIGTSPIWPTDTRLVWTGEYWLVRLSDEDKSLNTYYK